MALNRHDNDQIARIAEAESYAARSQLVRRVDTLLSALQNVQGFWATYGSLPREQWTADAQVELEHYPGVRMILWDDPGRAVRYAISDENSVLDYRPSDEEWADYETVLTRLRNVAASSVYGPYADEDGHVLFEFYVVEAGGRLAAIIDAEQTLATLLLDESPGYAIRVYWEDLLLYERGDPAADVPASWTREGLIRSSADTLWRVIHAPTTELAASLKTPAIDVILLLGLLLAVLMGSLIVENGRARSRAVAAEAAEQALAEMNRGLEQRIEDRTRELADRTTDLETITDSVTHDLRNPLNVISMNVQLMELEYADTFGADGLTLIQRTESAVRQMSGILDRLLGLTSVTHSTFNRESLDMRELVAEVFEGLIASEPTPKAEIRLIDLPVVSADRTMLQILVLNLLSNALKFTRQNESRLIEVSAESNGVTVFSIKDNGTGFDPEFADDLFVAFNRGNTKVPEGVGLGLAIAARVVQRHGGRIWAESTPGQGAAFRFSLEPESASRADPE